MGMSNISLSRISCIVALICVLIIHDNAPVYARAVEPVSLAMDSRIRTVFYRPNAVYKFVAHYGFQSSIEFKEGETIRTISIGDSIAWQITPQENRIFIKPIEQDADTNMTVITDERIYHFELYANETTSMHDPELIFVMQFIYPDLQRGEDDFWAASANENFPPNVEDQPEKYNFNYTITGPQSIAPVRIFDDGKFTYFEFPRSFHNLPAIFEVNRQDRESVINFRKRENYIIVERLGGRFTLRYGIDTVCVYNETWLAQEQAMFPHEDGD